MGPHLCSTQCFSTVYSRFSKEIFEEFLVENESHATDLLHFGFRGRIAVDKVGSYGYSKFATKIPSFENL